MSGVGRTKMNNINSLRRSLRMSQAEFAEHCDMSVVSISRYESGAKISRNNAEKIAQACEVPLDYVLGKNTGYSSEEQELVMEYRSLSKKGKELVMGYVHDMGKIYCGE